MSFVPTLLKYEFAVEAEKHPIEKYKEDHEGTDFEDRFIMCKGANLKAPKHFNKDLEVKSLEKEKEDARLNEILDYLFPPRTFFDNGKDWIQFVSKYLSNSFDLKGLEGELERMLLVRCVRKKGLCPIRRQIYEQLFDELIRQVTIDCIEGGLFLNRVKKEMNNLFEAYRTLLQFSEAFIARKTLEAKNQYNDRLKKQNVLILEKKNLERQVVDLKLRVEQIDKKNQDIFKKLETKNGDQINYFKLEIQNYKAYIDAMMTGAHSLDT